MVKNKENMNQMAQVITDYLNKRRADKELKLLKGKPDKKRRGGINSRLVKKNEIMAKRDSSLKEKLEVIKKEKKPKELDPLFFEQQKYHLLRELAGYEAKDIEEEYTETLAAINAEHTAATWLDWAAEKAANVSLATHVAKLTNSSVSATNILDSINCTDSRFLTTSILKKRAVDGAYGNAALAPIATLLQLNDGKKNLAHYVLERDFKAFRAFTRDERQIGQWIDGFLEALDSSAKTSHYLAKQIYFPINDESYHLLLPLKSSSLAQGLFEKFQLFYSKEQKKIRDQRKAGMYSSEIAVRYPQKAVLRVTASQHQNASALNGKRSGRLNLLPSLAPKWKSTLKPPTKGMSLFQDSVSYRTKDRIAEFQRFLLLVKTRKMNVNNPRLHKILLSHLDAIIEALFNYVLNIQNLENQAGWSTESKLKLSHQLWLDPNRLDEEFQEQRRNNDWQQEITKDFSAWLRHRLKHKKLVFSLAHERFWEKIFKRRFQEFEAAQEGK